MAAEKEGKPELETIWEVSDALWQRCQAVLMELDPPKRLGRSRIDQRRGLNGIIFRLRSGCQWNHLPREFGDDSSVHRTFQRWGKLGVFARLWGLLLEECQALGGVDWQWQAADGAMGKARLGGTLLAPTPLTGASGE